MNEQEFLPARARRSVLANSLRVLWLLQALVLLLLAFGLVRQGVAWPQAAILVISGWGMLQFVLLAFGFVLKLAVGDWPPATRGSLLAALRTATVEIGWMVRFYLYDHPWRSAPVQILGGDERAPLMLVHGFLCNGAVWRSFVQHLRGRSYAAISLEPTYRHFQRQLHDLHQAVVALCARSGREQVLLVGHSMGALLVRAYAERHPERCAGVVLVAAPHHGTLLADYIYGVEAGPPSARCQWLQEVNQRDHERVGVPALNLWTADDNIVIPARSAQLSSTPERTLHGHGHLAAVAAARACATLVAAITQVEAGIEHGADATPQRPQRRPTMEHTG
jgi:pimeloyl-ACP methyl ester carboxylesterase